MWLIMIVSDKKNPNKDGKVVFNFNAKVLTNTKTFIIKEFD